MASSPTGATIRPALFACSDFSAFWTAFDPLDMASESIDPLGFMAGYISLADRILPGFTTITNTPRYLGALCRAIKMAVRKVDEVQSVTARRRFLIEKIKVFERAWALSCGVLEQESNIGVRATENLRGIRAVRRWLDLNAGKETVTLQFSLLSNQVRYGGIGAYSAMLEAFHLADMQSVSLRALGEELADAFPSPEEFDLEVMHEDSRLDKVALLEWGRVTHVGDLSTAEARILRETLQGGEESEFEDATRWSMLRLISLVDPDDGTQEKQLLRRCREAITDFKKPENDLSCDRIENAIRVIEPYESLYQAALFVFNSARLLVGGQSCVSVRAVLKSPGVDQACKAATSNAARFLSEYQASSSDRSSLGGTLQTLQKLGLVDLARAVHSANSEEALFNEIITRHLKVQEGKFDNGKPKGPWIRFSPGTSSSLVLTAQKFALAPSDTPKAWQSVERHPYRTWAARQFIRRCKIS
jgi:hypothetical protein